MTIRESRKERRERMLLRLALAVAAGERCPTTDQGLLSDDVSALAHAGKISVEVSTHNWRRVTILVGEHAGKSTAPNPLRRCSIYLTIDSSGTRRNGRPINSGIALRKQQRQEPSKPRLLGYAGK
jgi:hypothetical protein